MRVCFASLHYDPAAVDPDPARYLGRVPIHRALPRALVARGHEVHVVHLYPRDHTLVDDGVRHHFVSAHPLVRAGATALGRITRRDPIFYQPAPRAIATIRDLRPAVVHFHGLTLTWHLALTLLGLGRDGPPVVVQYHGGYPARRWLPACAQRLILPRAARVLFTTRDHARPFIDAGLVAPEAVLELMETSALFERRDRTLARRETGMHGDPVFVWAGRLAAIKDPLTALRGFARILDAWPESQLYLHYLTDELLPELRAFVAGQPGLAGHVHFRGRARVEQMESIFQSADFLLQASQREFSGCAVLEAMACGVIPVVTAIPSFRAMTDDGRYGVLFRPGDPRALADGVLALRRDDLPVLAAAVRSRFERVLSFAALAERLDRIYAELVERGSQTPRRSSILSRMFLT
jgi:glycosyltransferase involved in cell wall biosynthesis